MTEELKRCPFCGGKANVHKLPGGTGIRSCFVMCENCLTSSNNYHTEDIAADMWNRRVHDEG